MAICGREGSCSIDFVDSLESTPSRFCCMDCGKVPYQVGLLSVVVGHSR